MRPFLKLFEYQDEKGLKMIEHETLMKKDKNSSTHSHLYSY